MFSADVFLGKERRLAEKWTSPQPARERLLCSEGGGWAAHSSGGVLTSRPAAL